MKGNVFLGSKLPFFLIIISLLWGTATSFAEGEASIELSSVSAKKGETVIVPVTLTSSGNIRGLQFDLEYDQTQLNFSDVSPGLLTSSFLVESNPRIPRVLITSLESNIPSGTGTIAVLTFTVNSGATSAKVDVQFTHMVASSGESGVEVALTAAKQGEVTISDAANNNSNNQNPSSGTGTTPSNPSSGTSGTTVGGGGGGGAPSTQQPVTPPVLSTSIGTEAEQVFHSVLNGHSSNLNPAQAIRQENQLKQNGRVILLTASKAALPDQQLPVNEGVLTATMGEGTVQSAWNKMNLKRTELQAALQNKGIDLNLNRSLIFQIPQTKIRDRMELRIPSATQKALQANQVDHVLVEFANQWTVSIPATSMAAAQKEEVVLTLQKVNVKKPDGKVDIPVYEVTAAHPVQVQLDVSSLMTNGADLEKLTAYQWKQNKWVPIGGKVQTADKQFRFTVASGEPFTVQESALSYQDLASVRSWAQKPIEVMAGHGFIDGRNDKQFDPMTPISRAEYVQLIVRTLGLDVEHAEVGFKDVDASHPYFKEVNIAGKLGIVAGVGEGQFLPNKPITREEMAAIISRTLDASVKNKLKKSSGSSLSRFKDQSNISTWAKDSVDNCVQLEWIKGMKADEFKPKDTATRAQATVMMYQLWSQP